jgi:hypothetical protein
MFSDIYQVLLNAFKITGFIFVMMLVIEYVNVRSRGFWRRNVTGKKWRQYLIAGVFGAIPGCLGAFTIVALFSHRLVSFGTLVTTMLATSGDEAFVMFAMFPKKALLLTAILFVVGIIAGYLTDKFYNADQIIKKMPENKLPLHDEPQCKCFEKDKLKDYLFRPSRYRLALIVAVLFLIVALLTGLMARAAQTWVKVTILASLGFSLFVVASVPDHFIKQHIWDHIVKVHIPRIFLWTFGTLLVVHFLMNYVNVESWLSNNMLLVLILAVLVGMVPESGPHLVFVTLFAQGSIPFSVLIASSLSQDGHGTLPLLAESKRSFLMVKLANIFFALIFGLTAYFLGF